MRTFEEILSYHTGYTVEELTERATSPILQPYDVFLAKKEWEQEVKLFAIPDVSDNEVAVCDHKFEKHNNPFKPGWPYYKCTKCGIKQTDC